jgi:heterodisulfide reductase subunit B
MVTARKRHRRKLDRSKVDNLKDELRLSGCVLCGYNKCVGALDFHHVSSDKEQTVSKIRGLAAMRKEAAKCIVVCANCHREIHAGQIDGYEDVRRAVPMPEEPPLLRLINS